MTTRGGACLALALAVSSLANYREFSTGTDRPAAAWAGKLVFFTALGNAAWWVWLSLAALDHATRDGVGAALTRALHRAFPFVASVGGFLSVGYYLAALFDPTFAAELKLSGFTSAELHLLHLPPAVLPFVLLESGAVDLDVAADCLPSAAELRRQLLLYAAAYTAWLHTNFARTGAYPYAGIAKAGALVGGGPVGAELLVFGVLAVGLSAAGNAVHGALEKIVLAAAGVVALGEDDELPLDPMATEIIRAARLRDRDRQAAAGVRKAAKAREKAAKKSKKGNAKKARAAKGAAGPATAAKRRTKRRGRSRSPRKGTNSKSPGRK